MRTVEAAVAAVLVVSMVAASVAFQVPAKLYDLAFQPTPDATQDQVNFGGNPGRTWVLGDREPHMGGFRKDPDIPMEGGYFDINRTSIIVGNAFVFSISDNERDELVRYDLDTHERVWTSPVYISGTLASDGSHVFGMRSDRMSGTIAATLVAIDLETGEIAWAGPELANRFRPAHSLVLEGETIFATDYLGNIVAVNRDDGSLQWQYPDTFAVPPTDEDAIAGNQWYMPPQIAATMEALFVAQPSKSILKLDHASGAVLDSINIIDRFGADIFHSIVQATEGRLVVTALHAERTSGEDDIRGYIPTTVLLFDADSLELGAQTELPDYRGNAVITDDAIYLPANTEEDGEARLYRIDPGTGKLGEPLEGVSAQWDIALSASGSTLMATGDPSTIAFFDLDSGQLVGQVELGITNMETPFGGPVVMWGDNPIVITGLSEVYVVTDEPAGS